MISILLTLFLAPICLLLGIAIGIVLAVLFIEKVGSNCVTEARKKELETLRKIYAERKENYPR